MATSIGAFLMLGTTSGSTTTYSSLCKIKSFPALGATPEALESTTCADPRRTFEEGLEDNDVLEFTANYSLSDYTTIKGYKGVEKTFQIWIGGTLAEDGKTITPSGDKGKYEVKGYISAHPNDFDVNTIIEMTITIIPIEGPVLVTAS